jgi:hypothetical protein
MGKASKKAPGVLFFPEDFHDAREIFTEAQLGKIFLATLEYAEYGILPDFSEDKLLQLLWGQLRHKVDRNQSNYDERIERSRWGPYKREAMRRGEDPLSFEAWREAKERMGTSSPIMSPSSPIKGTYQTIAETEAETEAVSVAPTKTANKTVDGGVTVDGGAEEGGEGGHPPSRAGGSGGFDFYRYEEARRGWK